MKKPNDAALNFTAVAGIVFVIAIAVFVAQILTGTAKADNQFLRVFGSGFGAIFGAMVLILLLRRTQWLTMLKIVTVVFNLVVTAIGLYLILNFFWP